MKQWIVDLWVDNLFQKPSWFVVAILINLLCFHSIHLQKNELLFSFQFDIHYYPKPNFWYQEQNTKSSIIYKNFTENLLKTL